MSWLKSDRANEIRKLRGLSEDEATKIAAEFMALLNFAPDVDPKRIGNCQMMGLGAAHGSFIISLLKRAEEVARDRVILERGVLTEQNKTFGEIAKLVPELITADDLQTAIIWETSLY